MDILSRIEKLLQDETGATVTGNIEPNPTKGNVDVIGGDCPKGQRYCERRKICVPIGEELSEKIDKIIETTYSGVGYGTGAAIAGSGQTRAVGMYSRFGSDSEVININKKRGVKWNSILGTYVPKENEGDEV